MTILTNINLVQDPNFVIINKEGHAEVRTVRSQIFNQFHEFTQVVKNSPDRTYYLFDVSTTRDGRIIVRYDYTV